MEKAPEDVEAVAADICAVLDMALQDFNGMREREGAKLSADILSRAGTIEALTAQVEAQSPKTVAEYRGRLENKMKEVLQNTQIDESRILTEAAIVRNQVDLLALKDIVMVRHLLTAGPGLHSNQPRPGREETGRRYGDPCMPPAMN